ncbi:MAG: (p)ppGpp synthetase I SpoT/RelA, GTP pyrophosphokinase [Candidatus Peregrinibacteria bacterium GW2011_GWE2_39_6]|nr:MAG: (p)ppGpp synthetase I SpoT/RelA, GTP pyrophosphokinase [Candidatus Peregrinibacteria bacterium GW2011_GWF2_39_17]KKR25958.1 MAG: (p)ppGpp synthetase I SpoT/RelA, GTP pyrophosphokinase [Candidatus Peregrinibacteria bacterium GW2011_GWE2_39_6]HCW32463.1 hypothetical protein [Candidatus Peregrinibacteria bacterium]
MGVTIETILERAKTFIPNLNAGRVRAAYEFADKAHHGQIRLSGKPYIVHELETTALLLSLKPDEDTLVAALLHDVPPNTEVTLKIIERQFGGAVARLIRANEKLSLIKVKDDRSSDLECWRRMFMAIAKDLRVIFIRLADRLHNMRTISFLSPDRQKRIAHETLYVYAPIASRLGLYSFKSELEDLCFQVLYPEAFREISGQIEARLSENKFFLEEAQSILTQMLKEEELEGEVTGRIKHSYSIYRKMRKNNVVLLDDIVDFFALRIVLPDQQRSGREFFGHCYHIIGAIHSRWIPMAKRFKDYIAVPKLNGYRSLHTTVLGLVDRAKHWPIEIQVRTNGMHHESEYGIASHWFYEDSRRASVKVPREELQDLLNQRRLLAKFHELVRKLPEQRAYLESLISGENPLVVGFPLEFVDFLKQEGFSVKDIASLENTLHSSGSQSEQTKSLQHQVDWLYGLEQFYAENNSEFSKNAELNLFRDHIFVLTPDGDVKDFPVGSTPIDFAYSIHSEVGHCCLQAKVNGHIVRLDYQLQNGDMVEIMTRNHPQPNRYWLSFTKTEQARDNIKAWFRRNDRENNIRVGRELLNKELKTSGKALLDPEYRVLANYGGKTLGFADREHIVELVGGGTMTAANVFKEAFTESNPLPKNKYAHRVLVKPIAPVKADENEVLITGESQVPVTRASCCQPRFPSRILGHVTRGRTVRVHRADCRELQKLDPARILDATWASINT